MHMPPPSGHKQPTQIPTSKRKKKEHEKRKGRGEQRREEENCTNDSAASQTPLIAKKIRGGIEAPFLGFIYSGTIQFKIKNDYLHTHILCERGMEEGAGCGTGPRGRGRGGARQLRRRGEGGVTFHCFKKPRVPSSGKI